jgi:hypothetical protein
LRKALIDFGDLPFLVGADFNNGSIELGRSVAEDIEILYSDQS